MNCWHVNGCTSACVMQTAPEASSSDQFVQQNISDVIARLAVLDAAVDAEAAGPSSSQQASGLSSEENKAVMQLRYTLPTTAAQRPLP